MKKGFYISDEYRTNPKSLVPGGWDVEVEYKTLDQNRIHSNIKNPEAYANHILATDKNIKSITVIGESKTQ